MMPEGKPAEPVDPRILFAAERTLFSYIRTGLALMGFGFVVARFGIFLQQLSAIVRVESPIPRQNFSISVTGILLVLCGAGLCVYAPFWFRNAILRLERGDGYAPVAFGLPSLTAVVVASIGVFLAVYLFFLR